jgi:hypothetical protein
VEHGRWSPRSSESAVNFGMAQIALPEKDIKLAAKLEKSQQEVWESVDAMAGVLSQNAPLHIMGERTGSLPMMLSGDSLVNWTEVYVDSLAAQIGDQSDAVGMAFAINGEINSADIYCHKELFKKMFPKLLKTAATEAIAEFDEHADYPALGIEQVRAWLKTAESGEEKSETVDQRMRLKIRENDQNVSFESYENDSAAVWIHKNILNK